MAKKKRKNGESRGCGAQILMIIGLIIAINVFRDSDRSDKLQPTSTQNRQPIVHATSLPIATEKVQLPALDATEVIPTAYTEQPTQAPSETPLSSTTEAPPATRAETVHPTEAASAVPSATRIPATARTTTREMYVYSYDNVNARSAPSTSAGIITTISPGTALAVRGPVEGSSVSGSTTWYEAAYQNTTVFVHSSLLRDTPGVPPQRVQEQVPDTAAALQQSGALALQQVSTPVPAAPTGFTCNCSKTCPAMASCEEAYFQLNQCGCGQRDGDNDGVPCETICRGG